jgi:hypothetical protein
VCNNSKINLHATSINTNGETTSSSFTTNVPSFSFNHLELSLLLSDIPNPSGGNAI